MTVATDQELLELAADRPEPVLTVLKRAAAFKPLIFVLALIPGLLVIQQDELTRYDSQFILQSLESWEHPFAASFSLSHWMTGLTLHLTELPISWRYLLSTYFFGVILVLAVFMLTQTMLNSRCGLLSAILLLMHPQYIEQLTHQVMPMCGLALTIISLWCYQRHLLQSALFSPYLLTGAVTAGLNMFLAPPFTYLLIAWLMLDIIFMGVLRYVVTPPRHTRGPKEIGMGHSLRFRLISLAGLGVVVFACGMFVFSLKWLREDNMVLLVPKISPVAWEQQRLFFSFLDSTSFLLGFIVIGLLTCLKSFRSPGRLASSHRFWVVGFLLSGLVWISATQTHEELPDLVAGWKLLFTITMLVFVAIAIDRILERQVSIMDVVLAYGVALFIAVWYTSRSIEAVDIWMQLGVTLLLGLVLWRIWKRTVGHELRASWFLQAGILFLLLMCLANGIISRHNDGFFAENVAEFEAGIEESLARADRFIVISEQDLQPTFTAVLKLQWMHRPLEHCRNWNEALNLLKSADQSDPPQALIVNTDSLIAPDLASSLPGWRLQPLGSEYYIQHYTLSCFVARHQ
ncbi:MAG: hypothetical protein CMJ46_12135 [Planctomyces sp.]|nr:hypothetical protein [Planctomyces sp.]